MMQGEKGDPKIQAYIKDIYTLLGKELPKDTQTLLEYSDELKKEVKSYEKSIDGKETGQLTQGRIQEILAQLDSNGEIIKKTETASEIKKEKHEYGDFMSRLEGKSYLQIKAILRGSTQKLSKTQIEALQTELGFTKGNTDRSKRIDGDLGPGTVKAFLEKYPGGMKDVTPTRTSK